MTAFNRWCLVALGVILVIGVPVVVRTLPAGDTDISAIDLLARVTASQGHGYTGYVESVGTLQLPVADRFTDVGALFGERTRMRVWWRDADHWRVDKLLTSGETDLVHDGVHTTQWDYEHAEAITSIDPDIRLPRSADLLPAVLGARLLDDVDTGELSRLPARRVAGIDAPGLRLSPASPQASIDHVDLWADPTTGIPLRIDVYDASSSSASFTSEFREFSAKEPDVASTSFTPTSDTNVSFEDVLDIADAANQYAPFRPPETVAGLEESSTGTGAVGVYGTGVTQLIAIPLRDREADPLREQLRRVPGVRIDNVGTVVSVGPLGVLLTGGTGDGGWLVAGTVTESTLAQAADDLLRHTTYVEDR